MEDEWKSAVEDGKDEEMQLLRAQLKQAEVGYFFEEFLTTFRYPLGYSVN